MPTFLLGDWVKSVSAFQSSLTISVPPTSAPNVAPPVPYIYNSPNTISAKFASTVLTVNTTLANGFVSAVNFFKTPQLPEGFETAKPVSPAKTFLFSLGDSVRSFFGFFSTSNSSNAMLTPPPPPVPSGSTSFDFDGDGKADIARWRASTGAWEIQYSGTSLPASDTLAAGQLAPADYNGDGATDLASFNNGTWNILMGGQVTQITNFGQSGDVPVSGNYIGSSAADLAVWRPSNGTWYVREVNNSTVTSYQFGQSGDIAVPGNYDGDSVMDYAIFRPLGGVWHIMGSLSGYYYAQWGVASDIPVPADFDGDGKTDMAVYRGSSGAWYALKSGGPVGSYIVETWGNYGDQPAPADYDNDGKADFSVYRPTTGVWHTKKSNGGAYEFHALGTPLDTAVEAAYVKQIGGQVISYDMAKTRFSPKNATGGTDLYSRNFGWSSSLVSLPGRAGLDMGFGISYNSLIWTKYIDPNTNNSTMFFDVDNSNISPGFRFGFPIIEPVYYESQTGKFSYLMVSPSGARTEFKQIGASDTYETIDSSYVQLKTKGAASPNDPVEDIGITVTGTDGTQMSYNWQGGAFRASQIKDRNGNYVTITHDNYGNLQSVTDTLGRVVNVNYDDTLYPVSITQTWKADNGTGSDITHYWARFEYTTIGVNPGFNGTAIQGIYGPTGGAPVKVLNKIIRADDSATVFEYQQNSFGQVSKIRNFAPDNHELNYVQTNLASPGTNLDDCPRLSQTKAWAENFNGGAEVVVSNDYEENQPTWGGGQGTIITVTSPDGLTSNGVIVEKSHMFGVGSGWVEALPYYSETCTSAACTGTDKKRWVVTFWTQDDTNLTYKKNPRVTSMTVSDSVSSRKTEYIYSDTNEPLIERYGLTKEVRLYDVYQNNTLLKSSVFNYKLTEPYLSKNIIGLPTEQKLYDGNNILLSKVTYEYDEGNLSDSTLEQNISPIMHDNTNFGASFVSGRGNPTSTTRHDVTGATSAVTSSVKYNTAGAVVASIDPIGRQTKIIYADKFKSGSGTDLNYNTYAYPTKLIDAGGNFSQIKYRYDFGANVWAKSPTPHAASDGKTTTKTYEDSTGRLLKDKIENNGAYTRYEYSSTGVQFSTFATITDGLGEAESQTYFDGAGRVRQKRSVLPGTSNWSGQKIEYDALGRVKRASVPMEVNNAWALAGDDANGDWFWTHQKYDWKGRVVREINTDGVDSTTLNDSDKLISYDGCGCAGGQITTIEGENITETDWQGNNPNNLGRRKQKIYQDILGRTYKTEIYNWDGTTVYSSTVTKYNGRDQVEWVNRYEGAAPGFSGTTPPDTLSCPTGTCQKTSVTYDGHGRVKTQHRPEQDLGKNTVYNYNADDTIESVTDARGAITDYNYNYQRLVNLIEYTVPDDPNNPGNPDPNVSPTHDVSFSYDALGNRISMEDGLGTIDYEYTDLSQLKSETREFDDSLPDAPIPSTNGFKLEYTYTISGQLKSLKDPYGQQFNYTYDVAGRLQQVAGSAAFAGITTYANNPTYNARGSLIVP